MKILKLKSILFCLMSVVMVTVFLSSCEKDQANLGDTEDSQNEELIFSNKDNLPNKEITLSDDLGNSVTLKISTENEEILNLYSDQMFKANFNEDDSEIIDSDEFSDNSNESGSLHNPSEERIKVFIEIAGLSLRNNASFSISATPSKSLTLRNYNIEECFHRGSSFSTLRGVKVKCTGRGKDGLSVYASHSSTAHCDWYWNHHSSRYFPSSGSVTHWAKLGLCIEVRVVGLDNYKITYLWKAR